MGRVTLWAYDLTQGPDLGGLVAAKGGNTAKDVDILGRLQKERRGRGSKARCAATIAMLVKMGAGGDEMLAVEVKGEWWFVVDGRRWWWWWWWWQWQCATNTNY